MEQNTVISSSSPSSSENVETKPSSLISAIAGTLSDAVHGVIQSAASTIQQGLHLNSSSQADDEDASTSSDSSSSPSLEEKAEHAKDIALDQGKEILSSASEKVSDVVDSVKASVASAVELAEEKIIRPPMAVAKASGALDKAAALFANMSISTEINQEGESDGDKKEQPVKEEGKTMSYSEYALEQFSRGGCTEKKLTMEMVAHIQRIADRTNDTVLHDMARKAHSAFAKGIHEAPGVHLTWITVEQANELVNLAIRTQDRALADFARYCQSVAATTQLGVEPFPGKIRQELEKGRADLAQQGRTHSGPGYGAAFSTVPRPQQQAGMTKSISTTAIATTKPAPISPSPSQQQIKPTVSVTNNNNNQQGMMKSYSTSNVQRTERYGFGPSPSSVSPTASGNTSPTSASAPTRASFGTAPAGLTPKVYAPPAPVAPQPQPQQQQQQQMQKSASAYYVPPSKAAAIANGYIPLSQRTPGMMMTGMMKSASSARADISASASGKDNNSHKDKTAEVPVVKKSMIKSFSTNTAAMPSVSTPIATDLKLTMDMVAHLQRIADRTGDSILHDTARKAHSACAKGLSEAPGVHLTKITPEQANELVNLAIRTQDHGLADFARYCQSVAATTQLGIEPSPGKIGQELAKGRLELAQQGRSYTGPGYGAAFASLNKSASGRDVALKLSPSSSPKAESAPTISPLSPPSEDADTHDAQGQIKADAVKAEPFVPQVLSQALAQ